MPFSFALLVDFPVLTYVLVFWQMPVSPEDLISQSTSESQTLKTLGPLAEFLISLCDTIKLAHQIPGFALNLFFPWGKVTSVLKLPQETRQTAT